MSYPKSQVASMKETFGDKAYIAEAMNRFILGEFAIRCASADQSWALLSAILDAVDRLNLQTSREPGLSFTEPDTIYYVVDKTIHNCGDLYVNHFPHPDVLNTIVTYADLVTQKPFDDESRELLAKLNNKEE